jgi:glyoxylase-like metal-dependent hydrolase (beta-lactamase superfamily II)
MSRVAAAMTLCASLAAPAFAEDPTPAPKHFTLAPAGDGVWAAIAKDGDRDSVGNAGFVVHPVRWVVNTHYHFDHVGGDAVFTRAGAAVIAHENERAWVRTENLKWRKEITAEDREMLAHLVLPDVTHRDGLTIWLGERRIDVLSRPGHTGGDSAVYVPSANVLFGGDLIWKETVPNLIDATTEEWVGTLDGFLQGYPSATFVPGHGELAKAIDVRGFREYLSGVRLAVARALSEGVAGPSLVEKVLPQLRARYGSWKWFDDFCARDIELTEQEARGTKKLPKPVSP